jgi:hypothetical protein
MVKSTYSVPDEWIGLGLRVVAGPFETKIICKDEVVVHARKMEGEHSIKLEHILKSLLRKPRAMIRWQHRELLYPDPVFKDFYRRLKAKETYPGESERDFLRVLNLIHHTSLTEIKCAIEIVLSAEGVTDFFASIKELLLIDHRPPADIIDLHGRFSQVPLNPNLKDYDELIPNQQGVIG